MATLSDIVAASSPDLAARLAAAEAPSGVRTFSGQPGHVRHSWGPGWALVGDAGYFKDPLSAHGITDALRDAELLARSVVAICSEGADERVALAAYQAQRDRALVPNCSTLSTSSLATGGPTPRSGLLLRLSAAMADEVEMLAALPPIGRCAQVGSP